jgi:hypothetical protein
MGRLNNDSEVNGSNTNYAMLCRCPPKVLFLSESSVLKKKHNEDNSDDKR